MIGIININKPSGITSSDVVVRVRKITGIKQTGHLGTLDPKACGVLPVCVGRATRLFDYFLKKSKTYVAEFEFGLTTDTLDSEGEITEKSDIIPGADAVKKALKGFIGTISQIPPKYSAKNVGGRRAYDLAREGINFELQSKPVQIFRFELLEQISDRKFKFLIECGGGTYIRSLCRDLAASLGTVAVMTKLTRIACGAFTIEDALDLDKLNSNNFKDYIIPLQTVLKDLPQINLTQQQYAKLRNGIGLNVLEEKINAADISLLIYNEKILGLAEIKDNSLKVKTYLESDK